MANKQALFGGRVVKVDSKSGFDKSRLNLLTTGVGTITPIAKQLVIPNSDGRVSTSLHAELPPLATNAYLRTHLKVEGFFCPLRLCYGGFESWFSGSEIHFADTESYGRAELPRGGIPFYLNGSAINNQIFRQYFGASTLANYFNVNFGNDLAQQSFPFDQYETTAFELVQGAGESSGIHINIFPFVAYHLIYDHWYRNKTVTKPLFSRPGITAQAIANDGIARILNPRKLARYLPYVAFGDKFTFVPNVDNEADARMYDFVGPGSSGYSLSELEYSDLFYLHQRNYGDDYFTAAKPNAQQGNPVVVDTSGGSFTISALRAQNALQEFAEVNNYATPDFVQAVKARYGASLSQSVAQHPVLLGSVDFPMFTKGVELNNVQSDSWGTSASIRNPFAANGLLGATAGRASANGQEFVCDFHADEPGYIMLLATLVPEANYSEGIAHDMTLFTKYGDLTDLPCSLLENIGDEPIFARELYPRAKDEVFGYVQRYLWHKCASPGNEVHGLFVPGQSLDAFAPYRPPFAARPAISSDFLRIPTTALDSVAAVESGISQYGVMLDCAIRLTVSEPLSESTLPSLADPAREHGRSVYLANGGSKLA